MAETPEGTSAIGKSLRDYFEQTLFFGTSLVKGAATSSTLCSLPFTATHCTFATSSMAVSGIAADDDEIGELARFQRAEVLVVAVGLCCHGRCCGQSLPWLHATVLHLRTQVQVDAGGGDVEWRIRAGEDDSAGVESFATVDFFIAQMDVRCFLVVAAFAVLKAVTTRPCSHGGATPCRGSVTMLGPRRIVPARTWWRWSTCRSWPAASARHRRSDMSGVREYAQPKRDVADRCDMPSSPSATAGSR
jgi:hypothetical protein